MLQGLLFLFGLSGSGKTTVAERAAEMDQRLSVFRGGDRLRLLAASGLNHSVASAIRQGHPVSATAFLTLVEMNLSGFEGKWLIFDGFPRSRSQAYAIPKVVGLADVNRRNVLAAELIVDSGIAASRVAERPLPVEVSDAEAPRLSSSRPNTARPKAEIAFLQETRAALRESIGYHEIDAHPPLEVVARELIALLAPHFLDNQRDDSKG